MTEWALKRFWTTVAVSEQDGGFAIQLDGRPVRTPAKRPLVVPTRALAEEVAAEWAAQEGQVDPMSMPATRLANAALDKVAVQHAEVADMLADYGDSDLLCYRAEAPADLVARQAAEWDPLLDWAADTFGACLAARQGVMHAPQDPQALALLRSEVHAFDPFRLAAFHDLVALSGSLIVALAAARGARTADALWQISHLDEAWQQEQWGEDEEAAEVAERKRQAFLRAQHFFTLCDSAQ